MSHQPGLHHELVLVDQPQLRRKSGLVPGYLSLFLEGLALLGEAPFGELRLTFAELALASCGYSRPWL
jgi:hypothetical protein